MEYLRSLLLINLGNADAVDATSEMKSRMESHASTFSTPDLIRITNLFNSASGDLRSAWQPSLALELALAEAIEPQIIIQNSPITQKTVTHHKPDILASKKTTVEQSPPPVIHKTSPKPSHPESVSEPQKNAPSKRNLEPQKKQETAVNKAEMEAPAQEQVASATTTTLSDIKNHWREIRHLVRDASKPTEALLNSCKLLNLKNNALTLGFSTDVLCSKMNTKENLSLTSRAVNHILNTEITVRCVVMDTKAGKAPENLDFDSEGIVGTALNLGGQIVDRD